MVFTLGLLAMCALLIGLTLRYAIVFPLQPFQGPLPPLTREEAEIAGRLERHVRAIATRPRNLAHFAELEAAAHYIEATVAGLGLEVETQSYAVEGRTVRNLEIAMEPRGGSNEAPILVVGAHYDSAGLSPGANDNATGVAATLELARLLEDAEPQAVRLRLVFWVNEEAPFGKTPSMGSYHHAARLKDRGERVAGAISLETLGYFSDRPGSQAFPRPFDLLYQDLGNFLAFVGLPGSRAFVHRAVRSFRRHTAFPAIGGVAPGFIEGIDYSDHWSYSQMGYSSFMVTDTAPFRNPHYHKATDLPETVDYKSLARVTKGLERMIRELAE